MMRRARGVAILVSLVAVALAGLAVWAILDSRSEAARNAAEHQQPAPAGRVSTLRGESVITLDAAAQRNDGIATAVLANVEHRQLLRAYGKVLDPRPLTVLSSRYNNAKAQLEIAEAKLASARTAFDRARTLYAQRQSVSQAQREAAEAEFRVAAATAAAAQEQLRATSTTAQQDWGSVLGNAIVNATPLLRRLLAREIVLVQVTLHPGQRVEQPLAGAALRLDDGSQIGLDFISAATGTDPQLQGPSFLFTAAAKGLLLPGMKVVALLPKNPPVEGVAVPEAAIVWQDGRAWAYFRIAPDRFARRALATDRRLPGGGYLVQGIANGSQVVVTGAQMLLSEEFRSQTQAGGEGDTD